MIPTVVYDANVLYPSTLRDVLIRIGVEHLVVPRWTAQILDETFGNLAQNRPDLSVERLVRTRELMNATIPDVQVTGYEHHLDAVRLPDDGDRHVVAAAIQAAAAVIVTKNLRDFPADSLAPNGITAVHPDDFLTDLADRHHGVLAHIVRQIARTWRANPAPDAVLDSLAVEAPKTAELLRTQVHHP